MDMRLLSRSTKFPNTRRHLLLLSTALTLAAVSVAGQPGVAQATDTVQVAQAAERPVTLSIPPQSLDTALTTLADRANLRLIFKSEDIAGLTTSGLSGTFSTDDALRQLLAGTGVTWRTTEAGAVTLEKVAVTGAMQLDPVTVEGFGANSQTAYGPVVGYQAARASTATRTDADVKDIPQSITVVTRDLIEDREVRDFGEIADTVPGVEQEVGYGGLESAAFIHRGFTTGQDGYINGFPYFGFTSRRDLANVERVEFLKGPASVLYGSADPGGMVNTVTKRPLATNFAEVSGWVDGYGYRRGAVDLSAPLAQDGSVRGRVNASAEGGDTYRDKVSRESYFIAPIVAWDAGKDTRLELEMEAQKFEYTFDRGFRPQKEFFQAPVSRFLGESWAKGEGTSWSGRLELEHDLNDAVTLRQGFFTYVGDLNSKQAALTGITGTTVSRRADRTEEHQANYGSKTEVLAKFSTGSIGHEMLGGINLSSYDFSYDFDGASLASIDLLNPQYGAQPGTFTPSFAEEYGANTVGVYGQNLVTLTDELKVLAGLRFDYSESEYRDRTTGRLVNRVHDRGVSPRLGAVYQPWAETSFYANWMTSFQPQMFSRSRTGETFEPETGQQFEVGVKHSVTEKSEATVSFFHITKQNVLVTDPVDARFSVPSGEHKSRGVELELLGEVMPGWDVAASYAFVDAFVSKDSNASVQGTRLVGVPRHTASLWTTHRFQSEELRGFGVGAGAYYSSDRVRPASNLVLPSYVRYDMSAFYEADDWRIQLSGKNLTDVTYHETNGFFWVMPQAPRTFILSGSLKF